MAEAKEVNNTAFMDSTGLPTNGLNKESSNERLAELTAKATSLYAVKKYEKAAEIYSEATELQAEVNGEMSEDNADLLFAYGRCLFYVAQKTSTVLGGTATSAQLKGSAMKPSKRRKANGTVNAGSTLSTAPASTSLEPVTETAEPADVVPVEDVKPEDSKDASSDTPYFQIEGDAPEWSESEDEEDEGSGDEEDEEEEDDFTTAFEILDLSRILYQRKQERLQGEQSDGRAKVLHDLKVRISDVYDFQAEISLEGEKYDAAATDLRECLKIKQEVYPPESALLAECHYKLSLALEAASTKQERDSEGNPLGEVTIDWKLREEAAKQQDQAIESCKLRIAKANKDLDALSSGKEKQKLKEEIEDVEDMLGAMQQRLEELKKPPVSVKAEAEKDAAQEMMGTILGQLLGADSSRKEEQKQKLAEVMAGANDLSGMVKRKKPKSAETEPELIQVALPSTANGSTAARNEQTTEQAVANVKGKRKFEEAEQEATNSTSTAMKKVRIEDVVD